MSYNILLISKNIDEASVIVEGLQSQKNYKVFLEKNAKDVLNRLKENLSKNNSTKKTFSEKTTIDAFVMNLDYFGMTQVAIVEQIRSFKFKFKIIIMAERVQEAAHAAVESIPNVVIIGKSYMDLKRDFVGFFKRAVTLKKIPKRTSKRHNSKQPAMVKSIATGETFNCTVFNLSTSGAYLEFERGHLNINDRVQIIIPLSQMNKTHALTCQLAWLQVSATGLRSAGLRFSSRALTAR